MQLAKTVVWFFFFSSRLNSLSSNSLSLNCEVIVLVFAAVYQHLQRQLPQLNLMTDDMILLAPSSFALQHLIDILYVLAVDTVVM